jgi:hypothetical protein
MSPIVIDLNKEPELKDLLADKNPGDKLDLHCSIKSIDDQTVVLTFEEASEGKADDEDTENMDMETEEPGAPALNEGGNGGKLAASLES